MGDRILGEGAVGGRDSKGRFFAIIKIKYEGIHENCYDKHGSFLDANVEYVEINIAISYAETLEGQQLKNSKSTITRPFQLCVEKTQK